MECDDGHALSGQENGGSVPPTHDVQQLIIDLQRHWLQDLQCSREKVLVELTEKMHQELLSDQQKIRTELLADFKNELDEVKATLESDYRERMSNEIFKLDADFNKTLKTIKKKQWCWYCGEEAVYFCCWNTSYCSTNCQHAHWKNHRKNCRRRKQNKDDKGGAMDLNDSGGPGGPSSAPKVS